MKQTVFYVLAAGLILSTGCSKKEETPAREIPAAAESMTEKAEAVTAQAAEKIAAVTEQAQVAAKEMTQNVEAVKSAFAVKPEQVMEELSQPVENIKTKVASLGQPELMAYANTYKDVLLEKKEQFAGLTDQLKSLPMGDMLGAKGKAIKDQLSQYTSQLSGLKERYSIYLDKLKALGVDLSAFGL